MAWFSRSPLWVTGFCLCVLSVSALLRRLDHPAKVDATLSLVVIGDWGRRGKYNQSEVALQLLDRATTTVHRPTADSCETTVKSIAKDPEGHGHAVEALLCDENALKQKLFDAYIFVYMYKMGRVAEKLNVDFVISTGDNFYDDGLTGIGDPAFEDSFSKIYNAKGLQKTWYNVLGNHDYRGDVLAQLNPVLGKIDKRWICQRSFIVDTEIAEFFFVDTTPFVDKYFYKPKDHKYDWRGVRPRKKYLSRLLKDLDLALKGSTANWKIVVGHHTIRSIGHHGDTIELKRQLLPILEANNVDMYINGHDHCLEHICSTTSQIQFLTSGGGSKAWKGDINKNNLDGVKFYYDGQGFMSMELEKSNAKIVYYDIFGQVLHDLNLSKGLQIFAI